MIIIINIIIIIIIVNYTDDIVWHCMTCDIK